MASYEPMTTLNSNETNKIVWDGNYREISVTISITADDKSRVTTLSLMKSYVAHRSTLTLTLLSEPPALPSASLLGSGDDAGSSFFRRDAFAASSATACCSASALQLLLCHFLPNRDCAARTRLLGAPPVLESGPLGFNMDKYFEKWKKSSKLEPVEEISSKKSRVGVGFSDCEIIGDLGLRNPLMVILMKIEMN
ncbi:hypothetical protein M9H77_27191 [Catharanthus roseus]|uniref:Uncharacterized protein n=1 Tax=Catharanthus roseus TaxID=4058 RepID=A0ACC0AEJ2_CATRO|nr:hypothetical protein M9H77_27191 [Catharanthus roseus]